jgi:uncharacterized membrane protein YqjE
MGTSRSRRLDEHRLRREEEKVVSRVGQWLVGAGVAAIALFGLLLLVALILFALQPPTWAQVAIGIVLTLGAAAFAWLIASALRSSGDGRRTGR